VHSLLLLLQVQAVVKQDIGVGASLYVLFHFYQPK
jgi:hypothetical protein